MSTHNSYLGRELKMKRGTNLLFNMSQNEVRRCEIEVKVWRNKTFSNIKINLAGIINIQNTVYSVREEPCCVVQGWVHHREGRLRGSRHDFKWHTTVCNLKVYRITADRIVRIFKNQSDNLMLYFSNPLVHMFEKYN